MVLLSVSPPSPIVCVCVCVFAEREGGRGLYIRHLSYRLPWIWMCSSIMSAWTLFFNCPVKGGSPCCFQPPPRPRPLSPTQPPGLRWTWMWSPSGRPSLCPGPVRSALRRDVSAHREPGPQHDLHQLLSHNRSGTEEPGGRDPHGALSADRSPSSFAMEAASSAPAQRR